MANATAAEPQLLTPNVYVNVVSGFLGLMLSSVFSFGLWGFWGFRFLCFCFVVVSVGCVVSVPSGHLVFCDPKNGKSIQNLSKVDPLGSQNDQNFIGLLPNNQIIQLTATSNSDNNPRYHHDSQEEKDGYQVEVEHDGHNEGLDLGRNVEGKSKKRDTESRLKRDRI